MLIHKFLVPKFQIPPQTQMKYSAIFTQKNAAPKGHLQRVGEVFQTPFVRFKFIGHVVI